MSLSFDGHLCLLDFMNNDAISTCVQVFVWTYTFISLGYMPTSRSAGIYGGKSMVNC